MAEEQKKVKSKVKMPDPMPGNPHFQELWAKLLAISETNDKTMFKEGIEACNSLKAEYEAAGFKSGPDT